MAEKVTSPSTSVVVYAVQTEPRRDTTTVKHDPTFVTQLLASAAGYPNMPQRRRGDRAGPLAAYASALDRHGRTHLKKSRQV